MTRFNFVHVLLAWCWLCSMKSNVCSMSTYIYHLPLLLALSLSPPTHTFKKPCILSLIFPLTPNFRHFLLVFSFHAHTLSLSFSLIHLLIHTTTDTYVVMDNMREYLASFPSPIKKDYFLGRRFFTGSDHKAFYGGMMEKRENKQGNIIFIAIRLRHSINCVDIHTSKGISPFHSSFFTILYPFFPCHLHYVYRVTCLPICVLF